MALRLRWYSDIAKRRRFHFQRTLLPVIGADDIILPIVDDTLGELAIRAQEGDLEARDALYFAFLPKLTRLMSAARPPYAPSGAQGIWDRDDVQQESYLVFIELVQAWSGDVSFTKYLLSRFPWRLKDAIRRGVGKSSVPPRQVMVAVDHADSVVSVDEPSPAANALLDALLAGLPEPLGAILVAHVIHGKTKTEIAGEIGVSRRTLARYWKEIQERSTPLLMQEDGRVC